MFLSWFVFSSIITSFDPCFYDIRYFFFIVLLSSRSIVVNEIYIYLIWYVSFSVSNSLIFFFRLVYDRCIPIGIATFTILSFLITYVYHWFSFVPTDMIIVRFIWNLVFFCPIPFYNIYYKLGRSFILYKVLSILLYR